MVVLFHLCCKRIFKSLLKILFLAKGLRLEGKKTGVSYCKYNKNIGIQNVLFSLFS